jgi:hypothetical protein
MFCWIEALVEELDVSVEAGDLTAERRVGLAGRCGGQGGSFGLEPGPAEHSAQLGWGLLVGLDLESVQIGQSRRVPRDALDTFLARLRAEQSRSSVAIRRGVWR